jgi:hypothetical protein
MKNNVFQCHGETTDKQQFNKTLGVLQEYINKEFTFPEDVARICDDYTVPAMVVPSALTADEFKDESLKYIWKKDMDTYMKRRDEQKTNLRKIYAIVWGQCSVLMQSKVESLEDFEAKKTACDCVWLLREIQGIAHRFDYCHGELACFVRIISVCGACLSNI